MFARMKWSRGHQSKDVEDRRGQKASGARAAKVGGAGAIVAVIVALIAQATGVDVSGMLGLGGSSGGGSSSTSTSGGGAPGGDEPTPSETQIDPKTDPDAELKSFIGFVLDDIQDTFEALFRAQGKTYRRAKLVLFTEEVDTGCGLSSSAIGPFYCPPDEKAYIDFSFYRALRDQLGAPGDFAQAYVMAHEIGHHLQTVLGISEKVHRQTLKDKSRENELSIRQELQADCFAGVWAHSTKKRDVLDRGDIEESVTAAAQIGDDRLQKMSGRKVNPETWTHGSSAQRVKWFKIGMEKGTLEACDTFAAEQP
jgi:predicted metalloprotease